MILTQLIETAIEEEYYTGDGKRVMLPIQDLVDLGLVEPIAIDKLKESLDYYERQEREYDRSMGLPRFKIKLIDRW